MSYVIDDRYLLSNLNRYLTTKKQVTNFELSLTKTSATTSSNPLYYDSKYAIIIDMKVVEFDYYDWNEFESYLNDLPDKDAAKLLAVINNIEEQGIAIAERRKWIKKLETNLYEIRSKYSSNIQRAIYFHWESNRYVITHGFSKKTQKTPKREIKKSLQRRNSYERSHRYEQN